jgi:predicted O-methyltransferase YrrM
MSYQSILREIAPNRPVFDAKYAILSAPVRHVMMMGVVWYLTKNKPQKNFNILEIGSWYGASALSWAQGLTLHNKSNGSITCVDAWQPFFDRSLHKDDVYVAMEKALGSDVAYNIFLHNISTVPEKIQRQHFRGISSNVLPLLRDNEFDVVFIDADHTYEPVKKDILLSLRLVKDGGIICGDDLNVQLADCDKAFAEKNKHKDLAKDPKTGRNFHPGVTVAVEEIFGKVSMWGGFWGMQKQGKNWKRFPLKGMPVNFPAHFPADAITRAKSHLADISPIT